MKNTVFTCVVLCSLFSTASSYAFEKTICYDRNNSRSGAIIEIYSTPESYSILLKKTLTTELGDKIPAGTLIDAVKIEYSEFHRIVANVTDMLDNNHPQYESSSLVVSFYTPLEIQLSISTSADSSPTQWIYRQSLLCRR